MLERERKGGSKRRGEQEQGEQNLPSTFCGSGRRQEGECLWKQSRRVLGSVLSAKLTAVTQIPSDLDLQTN
jgi:hypothetical protein